MGRPKYSGTYGYRPNPENKAEWYVVEEEAEVVRRIYKLFLSGVGLNDIGKILNEEGVKPPKGEGWYTTSIKHIIRNEKNVGDVTMQKTYSKDALTHKAMQNIDNVVEKYYVKDHHPAIISREDYELAVRTLDLKNHKAGTHQYPYYEYLKCPHCGKPMIGFALQAHNERAWICSDFKNCKNEIIREKYIDRAVITAVNSLPRAITGYEQAIKDSQDHFANDGKVELKVLKPLIKNIEIIDHKVIRIHFLFDKTYDFNITYDKPSEKGNSIIEYINGKLHFNGEPVTTFNTMVVLEAIGRIHDYINTLEVLPPEKGTGIIRIKNEGGGASWKKWYEKKALMEEEASEQD